MKKYPNIPELSDWGEKTLYQKVGNRLATIFNKGHGKIETSARIKDLVEKIFSSKRDSGVEAFLWEEITKEDYDFVLWLSTKNLKIFHSKIKNRVLKYKRYLRERDNGDELPRDYGEYAGKFYSWNQILRFISQVRKDVHSETFLIDQEKLDSRTDQMKSIYPNREEMVLANKVEKVEKMPTYIDKNEEYYAQNLKNSPQFTRKIPDSINKEKKEKQRISRLKKRRWYIESKHYGGTSKIPDSVNEEIIKFLDNSPYGTGLPEDIKMLLKTQLDYQYKDLRVFNFFSNTYNKTIECNFNFYGSFEGVGYWSGKAIYHPTKKQFELYDIYYTNRANEDGIW